MAQSEEELAAAWGAETDAAAQPDMDAVAAGAGGDAKIPGSSTRILNQDEIDSLLGFDAGDDDGKEKSGVRALINSALVSYERLPMLEVVFDRLVRLMTTSLRNFTSDNVEVSLDNVTSIRFGDYLNSIPLPAILAVFRAREWDNYGLLTVDSSLIYSIVDVLLGGRRGTAAMRIEGRPYTTIERNLVERLITVVMGDMKAAFEPLSAVTFDFDRIETNPRFATIARPANAAIIARLRIDMEDRGAAWRCCCRTRPSSPSVNCCCRCSWARSSAATPSGKTTSRQNCGPPTSRSRRCSTARPCRWARSWT